MQITLNIYERDFQGLKQGKAFEPQIWHRAEFLEKNFVRFFSPDYLTEEVFVVVPSVGHVMETFSFEFNGCRITVTPKFVGRTV